VPASDPLASLAPPASGPYSCPSGGLSYPPPGTKNGDSFSIPPGVYCGGIQVKNNTVTFQPGTYVLVGGGLTTQDSNSIIKGPGGVMFYNTFDPTASQKAFNTYSPISIAANSVVSLTAPSSGTYAGMLFFDDRSAPTGNPDTYGGGSTAVYQGIIYNRNNGITMYGNSSVSQYSMIIADTINLVGTTAINDNYSSLPSGFSPLQKVMVVE
jgi:hypothetical protein